MSRPESSPGIGQYGFPFEEKTPLFPVVKGKVDTKRPQIPSTPKDLFEPEYTEQQRAVLIKRYWLRDKEGKIVETAKEHLWRVAANIAAADLFYGEDPTETREEFYLLMADKLFYPNSPTLMNAGARLQQLSACFYIPIEDSMESIIKARDSTTWIHKTGGGTGFNFSNLRPRGSPISSGGFSSGPVVFMEEFFDATTEAVAQGGKRRGANMGILEAWHPDIREFITAKADGERLKNFNISVAVSDEFMRLALEDEEEGEYHLVDPHTGEKKKKEKAREIFELIVKIAHASGDPGLIFLDRLNEANPTPELGRIEGTNPCGEQPLLPYESCNLGSINLAKMVEDRRINREKLERVVKAAVHFLDNVIDMNQLPEPKIEEATLKTRKIGLGVMGFADMLIKLGVPYDSEEAIEIAEEVMGFINDKGHEASEELARKKGVFPAWGKSIYAQQRRLMHNATVTTIAPTGSISLIAGCSSGIEPIFALKTIRRDQVTPEGREIIHPHLEELVREFNLSEAVVEQIIKRNSLEGITEIPEKWRMAVRTAHEISPEWQLRLQAAFQRHTDNAVSKTINLPEEATIDDVREAYKLAWELGLKGITVYRYGSKKEQVLSLEEKEKVVFWRRPRPRPRITKGVTEKIEVGCGQTLYITINEDQEGLCEIFSQMGKSGGCMASQSEAIGRLVSLALRSGIETSAIVKQLRGIRCPAPKWREGELVLSCADAISQILEKYGRVEKDLLPESSLLIEKLPLISDFSPEIVKGERGSSKDVLGRCPECPDCGTMVEFIEGCLKCPECGYSQCS